jgi:Druantia protein DruA
MGSMCFDKFCGQIVKNQQLFEITEIIETFPNLSRTELANTVCELFSWKRPTGRLKSVECRKFLERLDEKGTISLPACRKQYANRGAAEVQRTGKADIQPTISAGLKELSPILLIRVETREQRQLWYEYVDRYHYLGYQVPFGAQLRYFIKSGANDDILGCFQFSSPAWKMAPRDRWIGWTDEQRKVNLQKIINNSRFLIFPWISVKNLASSVLALAVKTIPDDWQRCYGYRPVLMETLVDRKRFKGTCYKAANWIHMGQTTGRGRMDRDNNQQGASIKEIFVYPLTPRFRQELAGL